MFWRLSVSALAQCLSFQRCVSGELHCLLKTLVFSVQSPCIAVREIDELPDASLAELLVIGLMVGESPSSSEATS